MCRVCHCEGEPNRELFHPCKCDGSIKYIHQDCLEEWLKHSKQKRPKCELCGEFIKFQYVYKQNVPLRLTLLEFIFELGPRVIEATRFSSQLICSCIMWGIILPLFTIKYWQFVWFVAIISQGDLTASLLTDGFKLIFSDVLKIEEFPSKWYSGVVHLCILFMVSVCLFELFRIIAKVSTLILVLQVILTYSIGNRDVRKIPSISGERNQTPQTRESVPECRRYFSHNDRAAIDNRQKGSSIGIIVLLFTCNY